MQLISPSIFTQPWEYTHKDQTTTPGTTSPTLCKQWVGSSTSHRVIYKQGLWDGAYGLFPLSEKTRKSNYLQIIKNYFTTSRNNRLNRSTARSQSNNWRKMLVERNNYDMKFSTLWLLLSSNSHAGNLNLLPNQGRFLLIQFFGSTSPNANERTDIQQMGRHWMAKSLASSTGTSTTKESQAWQVGILLSSNLLHYFAIQHGGFYTMWPVTHS